MNSVNLIGRLVKDIEAKKTNNGKKIVNFSLAVRRTPEQTDFITCVAFDKTAEILENYCSKGSQIGVSGSIRAGKVDDKFYMNVLVNTIHLIGGQKSDNNTTSKQATYNDVTEPTYFGDEFPF